MLWLYGNVTLLGKLGETDAIFLQDNSMEDSLLSSQFIRTFKKRADSGCSSNSGGEGYGFYIIAYFELLKVPYRLTLG